ncbi:MAG: Rrf2 family transcriptional regulator [Longicatena sp.]
MKLSTKSRYALRSILDLALNGVDRPLSIAEISERQNISERYLELIFSQLKKHGFIISSRGSKGGYSLAKPTNKITVFDIVNAMELDSSIVDKQSSKDPIKNILLREIWNPIDINLKTYLSDITLQDLL